jgi:hypothetical protein
MEAALAPRPLVRLGRICGTPAPRHPHIVLAGSNRDSVASVGFVVTPDFEADKTVGISANDFAIHDHGLARINRRLRVVLGVGLRKRRGGHENGEGDGGQSNSQVRFHVQPHLEFTVQCFLHSANSASDKRAFDRASVQKNSLFIRI